ncbi:xylulokinase [Lentibacillus kapialis]|uniref:Xylulokinase n=1 Tax=Lentibacillus kapialis TaxID=340214 RepID=A0A917UZ50_9BACI|nr:FGGY family carbohydrate kinase [Lentibacillus kapialis]GGJ98400.1 xylulokinase [Lentibacillus kapialis]
MSREFVLGVDHGTGGCKVTCLRSDGKVVSEAYAPYHSFYPQERWVEQDPDHWIESAVKACQEVLSKFTADERKKVKGIGFSAPHHVAVLLNKNEQVIRNPIMWNDQRSGDESQELSERYGERIFELTSNAPTPTWTLCHLRWIQKNEPKAFQNIRHILLMKDYVRYRFGGEMATDYIEAEGTLLYNINKQEWSEELCGLISLNSDVLPNICDPMEQSGELIPEMAEALNLPPGIPIIIGVPDTAAEIYGSGVVSEKSGLVKLATAGNFSISTQNKVRNSKITTYHHVINNLYYQNSATNFAASSYRWFKEGFLKETEGDASHDSVYNIMNKKMEYISPGSEGLIFHPYLNGERSPHWDPYLKGSFFGITARHSRKHFARAILEGVGYSIRDASDEFPFDVNSPLKIIGGGSKGELWVQIMANIMNNEMEVPQNSDSSFGTCLIVATSVGWFECLKEATENAQKIVYRATPKKDAVNKYNELFEIYREFYNNTKDLSHKLTNIQERI